MSFIIYDRTTLLIVRHGKVNYATERAARAAITRLYKKRLVNPHNVSVCELDHYNKFLSPKKMVHNLMSGKPVIIDGNTPVCCDPSSETYWSM